MEETSIDEQRRTYQNRLLLTAFWERADRAVSALGRLALLREMVRVTLRPDPYVEHDTPRSRRHFEKRKARGHFKLKGWCWVCHGETPDARHHIIPIKNGGRNISRNIVPVCDSCHKKVHAKEANGRVTTRDGRGDPGEVVPTPCGTR